MATLKTIEGWEENRIHGVSMESEARKFEIMTSTKMITESQNSIGQRSAQKGKDEDEKSSLEADRADDQAFLDKVTEECEDKASKWDARSQRRFGELKAIATALDILKGDATAKYGSNKLALSQAKTAVSFLQVASVSDSRAGAEQRAKASAIAALKRHAVSLKDSQLFAQAMLLRASPFDSVKRMIEDLIKKIEDEQTSENEEIEDCKKDIEQATRDKNTNSGKIEEEEASIIELGAAMTMSTAQIQEYEEEVKGLYNGLKEATALRNSEAADNKQTLEDSKAGQESVEKAIAVLKEFYNAGFEGGFVQKGSAKHRKQGGGPDIGAPDAEGFLGDDAAADPSAQGEADGIFGLLETIKGDYETTIDKVTTEEDEAQTEYDDFKSSSESDIQEKKDMKSSQEAAKQKAFEDTEQAKEDIIEWTSQKTNSEHQLSILEPRCLGLGASAEERKKRRDEEKAALQDAITILESMAPAEAPEPSKFLQRQAAQKA